jgi:hypothetical protein
VLHAGPAVATTEAEEDVNGGALGGATGVSSSGHHRRRRRRWRAPGGAADKFGSGHVVLPMSGPLGVETHGHPTTSHGRHLCRAPLEVMLVPGAALHLVMLGIDGGTMAPYRGPDPSVA